MGENEYRDGERDLQRILTFPFNKNRVSKNGAKQISDEGRQLASAVCRGFGRNAS